MAPRDATVRIRGVVTDDQPYVERVDVSEGIRGAGRAARDDLGEAIDLNGLAPA